MLREDHQAACKEWRANNKAKISEYNKRYYAAHKEERQFTIKRTVSKEERANYNKEYYQNNRHAWKKHQASSIYKEYQRIYQSQRRKDIKDRGSYFPKDIKDLYASQGAKCYYCSVGIEIKFHIEHMVPLSRNGRNDVSNICLACVSCNLQKHTKTAEEFINEHKINQGDNYV